MILCAGGAFLTGLLIARFSWISFLAIFPIAFTAYSADRFRKARQEERSHLVHLKEAARRIGGADFARPVTLADDSELDGIAAAMAERHDQLLPMLARAEEAEMTLDAVFDALYGPAIQVDRHGIVRKINRSVTSIFQIAPEEACGQPFLHVVRDHRIEDAVKEALTHSRSLSLDVEVVASKYPGRYRVRIEPMRKSNQEQPQGAAILLFDVTRLRFLERVRSEFVSNISHELRTPITAVKGFIETVLEEDLPSEDRERFLRIVKEEVDRLEELLGDLLDLSLLESDTTPLSREDVDVSQLVQGILQVIDPKAKKKDIVVENRIPPRLPVVPANKKMLEQAVMNLVENAIKYTQEGGLVWVEARRVAGEHLELAVGDNGPGIPSDHLPRVFERFHRVDKARSRAEGGTGLGLAIVRHIVHRHGGSVRAESRLGKGSRFIVTLPLVPTMPRPTEWEG